LTLQDEILSKSDPYTQPLSAAPKQTGNTPRFGAGKKIGPLKPLNSRPNELAVISNENSFSDSSPITKGKLGSELHFRSQQEADSSPANRSLSPSNLGKFDTNSVGNSPRKRASALKHPLINKKSPLFKKFGMENFSLGPNQNAAIAADNYENFLLEKKFMKAPIDTEMMNIRNRANLTQMIEKHHEIKKTTENTQSTTYSSTNIIPEKTNETKNSAGRSFAFDTHSSEHPVHSEAVTAKISTKENLPITRNVKLPKATQKNNGPKLTKISMKSEPTNKVKSSIIGEAHSFCEGEGQYSYEYRRKKIYQKKTIPAKTSSGGNLKEGFQNESITSLELSAIVNDANEKDPLNLSKDEILLQYIDNEQDDVSQNKNPLKIKKQTTSDLTHALGETESNNLLRKSNSANQFKNLDQKAQSVVIQEEPITQDENKQQQKQIVNPHFRGRKMFVKSFISEEEYTENFDAVDSRIYENHDRNSSMYEISSNHHQYNYQQESSMIMYNKGEKNQVPEKFKQRRVESALPRGSNYYIENSPSASIYWKDNNKVSLQVKQQRLPNTEKNNVKHFQFLGSPNINHAAFNSNPEHIKKDFKKMYLNMKPGTTSGMNRNALKKDRPSLPHRIPNRNKFAFQSVGPYYSNLNDSGLGCDDSLLSEIGGATGFTSSMKKVETEENHILKLKEEIKKLQAKDQDAQVKIAKLHIQMETQNKEWEKKVEAIDQIWKQRLNQQREYYEKMFGNPQKKI